MGKCPIHPRYKAILAPRSTKPRCTCQAVYDEAQEARQGDLPAEGTE